MNRRLLDLKKFISAVCGALEIQQPKTFVKFNNKIFELEHGTEVDFEEFEPKGKILKKQDGSFLMWINLDKHQAFEEFLTILHELFHIMQLEDLGQEELVLLKKNYVGFDDKKHDEQFLELQANLFCSLVAKNLFGLEVFVNAGSVPKEEAQKIKDELKKFIEEENVIFEIITSSKLNFIAYKKEILKIAIQKRKS